LLVSSTKALIKLYSVRLETKFVSNPLLHDSFVFNLTKNTSTLNQNCVA
jgi:hypothetical protein